MILTKNIRDIPSQYLFANYFEKVIETKYEKELKEISKGATREIRRIHKQFLKNNPKLENFVMNVRIMPEIVVIKKIK